MASDMGGNDVFPDDVTATAVDLYRTGVPVRRILDATGLTQASLFELLEAQGLRRSRSSTPGAGLASVHAQLAAARETIEALQAENDALRARLESGEGAS